MLSSNTMVARIAQSIKVDVLIVGGGLSGLMVAQELEKLRQQQQQQQQPKSCNYKLLEARNVLGGRLVNDNKYDDIDLGGAWFWPQEQELMSRLVQDVGVGTFEQPPVHPFMSTRRFKGGAVQLVRKLTERIPKERIMLDTPVTTCQKVSKADYLSALSQCANGNNDDTTNPTGTTDMVLVQTKDGNDNPSKTYLANHVIFCVPPRLLSKYVTFDPPLSKKKQLALQQSNTWMAGVTKVALVYEDSFWKDDYQFQNQVGRIGGPIFQMYDSSTDQVAALTAFTLDETNLMTTTTSPTTATNSDKRLADQVAEQLSHAFQLLRNGKRAKQALSYKEYYIQRWPLEQYISEEPNPRTIQPHPHPVPALSNMEWNGQLLFAGTETDIHSPGVMEGALGSALRSVEQLNTVRS